MGDIAHTHTHINLLTSLEDVNKSRTWVKLTDNPNTVHVMYPAVGFSQLKLLGTKTTQNKLVGLWP